MPSVGRDIHHTNNIISNPNEVHTHIIRHGDIAPLLV